MNKHVCNLFPLDRMTNRGYSNSAGYGQQNYYNQRPNYNSGAYDQDRYYGRPYGQGQMQQNRPDTPEYYDRPNSGGGGTGGSGYRGGGGGSSGGNGAGGSYGQPQPHQDDYSFRPVDQTYR